MIVKGQLDQAQLENLSADPSNLPAGRIYWRTDTDRAKLVDDSGAVKEFTLNDAAQTLTNKSLDGDDNTFTDIPLTAIKTVLGDADKVVTRNASGVIQSTALVNANVDAAAAIARTKIASGSNDHVIINNGSGVLSSEANLAISRGGTGAGTATNAFNALSPLTTKGDLVVYNSGNIRLGVGSDGQVLKSNSAATNGVEWASVSVTTAITSKTGNYTATTSDDIIQCSGAAFTITLPTAVGNTGKKFIIKKTDSSLTNIITIDGDGTETVGGSANTKLHTEGETVEIVSDGTNWQITNRVIPQKWNTYTVALTSTGGGVVKGGTTIDQGRWRREGDSIHIRYEYTHTSIGTDGSGFYRFSVPSGVVVDTSKINSTALNVAAANLGDCHVYDGASTYSGGVGYASVVPGMYLITDANTTVGTGHARMEANNVQYAINAVIPVTDWAGI